MKNLTTNSVILALLLINTTFLFGQVPNTKLINDQCNSFLNVLLPNPLDADPDPGAGLPYYDYFKFDPVPNAQDYRMVISNVAGDPYFYQVVYSGSSQAQISFYSVPQLELWRTYNVKVSAKVNGQWGSAFTGPLCTVVLRGCALEPYGWNNLEDPSNFSLECFNYYVEYSLWYLETRRFYEELFEEDYRGFDRNRGNHSITRLGVTIYPNPSDQSGFNIDLTNFKEASNNIVLNIYNLLGEEVYSETLTHGNGDLTHRIEVSTPLNVGTYFVSISVNGEVFNEKIQVK